MAEVNQGGAGGGGTPDVFSQQQRDELSGIIGGQVGNMLKARFKTFLEKDLKDAIGPMLGESLKTTLPDLIKGAMPAPITETDPDDKDGKGKGAKTQALRELETKYATLQASNRELTERVEAAERARTEERKAGIDIKLRQTLVTALAGIGITNTEQAEIAAGHLIDAKKLVRWDEDTNQVLFNDPNQGEIGLGQGLSSWSRSPSAKYFMPASGATGSGSRPGNGAGGGNGSVTKDQALGNVFQTLLDKGL